MSESIEICCSFLHNLYFVLNIFTLILLIIFIFEYKNDSECFEDYIYNWDKTPIYDIYLTDEMTENTIKLGELEEYSNVNTKVPHMDIYKWKNKYINVKRLDDEYKVKNFDKKDYKDLYPTPIDSIFVSENETNYTGYKSLKIDDNNYLTFTNDINYLSKVIVDFKISFKKPYTHLLDDNYICFSSYCKISIYKCEDISNEIDSDSTNNLMKYNEIKIEIMNSSEYFEPESYSLYAIYDYSESKKIKKRINLIYNLYKAFIIINISTRIFKFLFFSNFLVIIIHSIDFSLLIAAYAYSSEEDKLETEKSNLTYPFPNSDILLGLASAELNIMLFEAFNCFYNSCAIKDCRDDCSNKSCSCRDKTLKSKKKEKKEKENNLNEIKKEIEELENKIKKNKSELSNIKEEIKKIKNSNKLNSIYFNNLNDKYENKINQYKYLNYEIPKKKDFLKSRSEYLEKLKTNMKNQKLFKSLNEQKLKLDINCIYYDRTIEGGDESSSGYEFFKFLKNSIKGVFFGIKNEKDLTYALAQLDESFKFIFIYKESYKDNKDFYTAYQNYFSHIIILRIELNESKEDIKTQILPQGFYIEYDYYNIISRLKEINQKSNIKLVEKYKPYKLILYSDYFIFKNISKCHKKLLRNTILDQSIDNNNNQNNYYKGINEEEYKEFISFLENDLKEVEEDENVEFPVNDENIYEPEESEKISVKDINTNIEPNNNIMNYINSDAERICEIDIEPRRPKKKYLGVIEKIRKENIIKYLQNNNYNDSRYLLSLYTSNDEKFYIYINKWLMSLKYEIYKKISPISGKIMNLLYQNISQRSSNLHSTFKKVLYRGFLIKKADIFLYKACIGDIICYPSFLSMTLEQSVAKNFANFTKEEKEGKMDMADLGQKYACLISLEYTINKGCKFQESDVTSYSNFNEEERLFPPFSFFKIEDVKINYDISDMNKYFTYPFEIHLKVINRKFYLDQAFLNNKEFDYDKNSNMWILKNNNN